MSASQSLTLRVQAMRYEARGIVSIELRDPAGARVLVGAAL